MMQIAMALASRATCAKLAVGCVLTDFRGRLVGTGYNGVPAGCIHCIEKPCPGATAPAGSDLCQAVHAEQNALMRCHNVDMVHTAYVTHQPCLRCTKMLLNTGCQRIIYWHVEPSQDIAREFWIENGRWWDGLHVLEANRGRGLKGA